jgi:hypothetical protein
VRASCLWESVFYLCGARAVVERPPSPPFSLPLTYNRSHPHIGPRPIQPNPAPGTTPSSSSSTGPSTRWGDPQRPKTCGFPWRGWRTRRRARSGGLMYVIVRVCVCECVCMCVCRRRGSNYTCTRLLSLSKDRPTHLHTRLLLLFLTHAPLSLPTHTHKHTHTQHPTALPHRPGGAGDMARPRAGSVLPRGRLAAPQEGPAVVCPGPGGGALCFWRGRCVARGLRDWLVLWNKKGGMGRVGGLLPPASMSRGCLFELRQRNRTLNPIRW